jgi:hypothetical protein
MPTVGFSSAAIAATNVTDQVNVYVPYLPAAQTKFEGQAVYDPFFYGPDRNIANYRYPSSDVMPFHGAYFDAAPNPYLWGSNIYMFCGNGVFSRRIVIPYTQSWSAAYFDSQNYLLRGITNGQDFYTDMDQSHYDAFHWPFSPYVYNNSLYTICHHEFYPIFNFNASYYNSVIGKQFHYRDPAQYPNDPIFYGCGSGMGNWINAITLLKSPDGGASLAPDPLNPNSSSQSNRCILTPMPSAATITSTGQQYFEPDLGMTPAFGFFHPTNLISETTGGVRRYYFYCEYYSRQRTGLAGSCASTNIKHGYVAVRTADPSTALGWEMFAADQTWQPVNHATWQGDHLPGVGGQEPYLIFDSSKGWQMVRYMGNVRKVGDKYIAIGGFGGGSVGFLAVDSLSDPRAWETWGSTRKSQNDAYVTWGLKTIKKGGINSSSPLKSLDFNPPIPNVPGSGGDSLFHMMFYGTNMGTPYDANFEYIDPSQGGYIFGTARQHSLTHAALMFSGI